MHKVDVVSVTREPRLRLNLVAHEAIEPGETVFTCDPSEVTTERTWRTIQVGFARHVKNEWLDYVDHSCEPNAVFDVDALAMVALRPIAPGQSITFFYPGAEVELAQGFTCACGAPDCVGDLRGAFYLSHAEMESALQRGYCTRFIAEHLQRLTGSPTPPVLNRARVRDVVSAGR